MTLSDWRVVMEEGGSSPVWPNEHRPMRRYSVKLKVGHALLLKSQGGLRSSMLNLWLNVYGVIRTSTTTFICFVL